VRVRYAVAAAVVLLFGASAVLLALTRDPSPSNDGLTVVSMILMILVGFVVIGKQPRNAVGWLLVVAAMSGLVDVVAREYLVLDYRQHAGRLALGWAAVEWRGGVGILAFLVGLPAILLFPDGKVPSRRWRRALWIYAALAAFFTIAQFAGQAIASYGRDLRVDVRGGLPSMNIGPVAGAAWLLTPVFLGYWLAFVGHQVMSWRRASGERRAQLKWLLAGGIVCVVSCVLLVVAGDNASLASRLVADASVIGIAFLPVAIGIGILKYRLYEIDRLISRTLAYAIVTGSLVAVFLGLVVLTTRVLPFSSPVGVAASTLAAAALFNPLRQRVQRFVDRRFNRARCDAEAIVGSFARRLRDAVDLETVQVSLDEAVRGAVQPAHVSVWLNPGVVDS
jgi:hypothetical protein